MHGSRGGLGDGPYTSGKIHFFKYIVRLLKICLGPPPPSQKRNFFQTPFKKFLGLCISVDQYQKKLVQRYSKYYL